MSAIPLSVFTERLRELSHESLMAFVADLWGASGWETTIDGSVIIARAAGRTERLLVLPPRRLARFRSAPPVEQQVDYVVTPRAVESVTELPRGTPDATLVDASDLRHRLLYGIDGPRGAELCRRHLDLELRKGEWESPASRGLPPRALLAVGLAVVAVLVFGYLVAVPFLDSGATGVPGNDTRLADGLGTETTTAVRSSLASPTGVATEPTVYVGLQDRVLALDADTGQQRWEFTDLRSGPGSPIVVNGTVYVRSFGAVFALDAQTGEQEWVYGETVGPVANRPTVVNGTVYIAHSNRVIAIDADNGNELWEFVESDTSLQGRISTPTVRNGTVYFGTRSGVMYALDARTGAEEWSRTNLELTYSTTPVLVPGRATGNTSGDTLVVSGSDMVYAFDVDSGEQRWEFEVDSEASSPAVLREFGNESLTGPAPVVYVTNSRGGIYALDASTGVQLWNFDLENVTFAWSPVLNGIGTADRPETNVTNRTVYVSAGNFLDDMGSVTAVDSVTGNRTWRFGRADSFAMQPTVADGEVFFATRGGMVYALDATDGERTWQQNVSLTEIRTVPTVVRDPYDGDSVDSHVRLGLEGNHDWLDAPDATDGTVNGSQFRIVDNTASETIGAGETGLIETTVMNTGDRAGSERVEWDVGWNIDEGAAEPLTLDLPGGRATAARLSFIAPEDTGEYEYTVHLGDESRTETVRVVEAATHEIQSADDPSKARQGGQVEILATIHNPDQIAGTTDVALAFDGEIVERTEQSVASNESVSVTFTLDIPDNASAGNHSYTVVTDEDAQTGTLEVITTDSSSSGLGLVALVFGMTVLLVVLSVVWWRLAQSDSLPDL